MIEMRVREDDGVDVRRGDRQIVPVPLPKLLEPLEQPCVNEDARALVLEQILRSGNRARRTEKRQRH
jgi:hypothetical protein